MRQYFGKYRGKVENNVDTNKKGRIQISVPAVLGDNRLNWAMPCVPYAGPEVGFFTIPPNGANVWIEFESGDLDRPIWSGCFWGENETVPASPGTDDKKKVLKSDAATITIDDEQNSVTIETTRTPNMKIVMDANGIEINNGKGASIKLNDNTVSINGNALEVT